MQVVYPVHRLHGYSQGLHTWPGAEVFMYSTLGVQTNLS